MQLIYQKEPDFEEIQTRSPWDELPQKEQQEWMEEAYKVAEQFNVRYNFDNPNWYIEDSWAKKFYEIHTMVDLDGNPLEVQDHKNLINITAQHELIAQKITARLV